MSRKDIVNLLLAQMTLTTLHGRWKLHWLLGAAGDAKDAAEDAQDVAEEARRCSEHGTLQRTLLQRRLVVQRTLDAAQHAKLNTTAGVHRTLDRRTAKKTLSMRLWHVGCQVYLGLLMSTFRLTGNENVSLP